MKFVARDLRKLSARLIAAVLMIALGATSVQWALSANRTAIQERALAQKTRDDIDGKLKRVRNEESEIKQKSAIFRTLQERGIIGDEQRLEWVELLNDIRTQRHLLELQYEFSPQHPLAEGSANAATSADEFGFYTSPMKLQLKLLHEEDLTRLLDDLRARARAFIHVKSCNVVRVTQATVGNEAPAVRANLQADCEIDWITLRRATQAGETKP